MARYDDTDCDDEDNDCDGSVDDNATDWTTWYADRDEYLADLALLEECTNCGEVRLLGYGPYEDECQECDYSAALFAAEDRATQRAENGYGYSGGWSGYEPPYLGD